LNPPRGAPDLQMPRISWFVSWSRQQCFFWMFSSRGVSPLGAPATHNPKGRAVFSPRRRTLPRGLSSSRTGGGVLLESQPESQPRRKRGESLRGRIPWRGGFQSGKAGRAIRRGRRRTSTGCSSGQSSCRTGRTRRGTPTWPGRWTPSLASSGAASRSSPPLPGGPRGDPLPEGDGHPVPGVNFAEGAVVIAKRGQAGGESADSRLYHKL